ncbi:hypothetical protein [Clostridium beijerinckii]|uniref:Uncharacterized protein n=1 Tax=Clostridium beijerinckii TaxID=1520 RepID=A0AAE5H4T8_CLOBE|nr:hypothetical protein [Clostridium beijerinckii]ALB45679.1 hypothetical protein X276_10585 [Clostridium beijerinckii NRRL B-598]NSB14200.1 hypothetical protein [Clostridium beijerinckii]OOM21507.1 hypothetical protein CLOBE_46800 [Clostridium beijerinckii]
MILRSEKFQIEVTEDKTFTIQSTDNKPYDILFNPENLSWRDITKAFRIKIKSDDRERDIILIGSLYCYDADCAILEANKLIVLMNYAVTIINIEECKILRHKKFSDSGCYFGIYEFRNGYIVYGELEIVKLDKSLNKEWDFMGADIFVTQDKNVPFQISGDKIKLYDWSGAYYELDMNGKVIYDTFKINEVPPKC